MLLSERELGLSDDHDGIVDLPADAPVGDALRRLCRPRRPGDRRRRDAEPRRCLGVAGIARDLAAAGVGTLVEPAGRRRCRATVPCPVKVTLDFGDTPSLCPAFGLRLVRGVKNGPSPDWLQSAAPRHRPPADQRAGRHHQLHHLRPRPAAARLRRRQGRRATSSSAAPATARRVLALDGKTYALDPTICVIADDNGVESIAGIMGGEASGCAEATTDVLIESALWEPLNIAADRPQARHPFRCALPLRARRRPGLHAARPRARDARWSSTSAAATPTRDRRRRRRAGAADGRSTSRSPRSSGSPASTRRSARSTAILEALGFAVAGRTADGTSPCRVPTWRPDVDEQGRPRRGGGAHRRRRPRAGDAAAARCPASRSRC